MDWVREGECNHCGECCKLGDPFVGGSHEPEHCSKHIDDRCSIYTERPPCCISFPAYPEHLKLVPRCSFTFRRVIRIYDGR